MPAQPIESINRVPLIYNDSVTIVGPTSGVPPFTANDFFMNSDAPLKIPNDRYLHLTNVMSIVFPQDFTNNYVAKFELHRVVSNNDILYARSTLVAWQDNQRSQMTDIWLLPGDQIVAQWQRIDVNQTMVCTLHGTWHMLTNLT